MEVYKHVEDAIEVAIPTTVGPILRALRLCLASQNGKIHFLNL